jgi:phage terminase Nu1 subunit (DNA packaging protein)
MSRRNELVPVSRLAKLFNCSERQVQLFASRDGMPKAKHGLYHLDECVRWRVVTLTNELSNKSKQTEERNIDRERARDISAGADLKELKLKERRGELVPISVYQQRMAQKISTARQQLLNLPSRVAHELVGLELLPLKTKLREGVHAALTALSTPAEEDDGAAAGATDTGSAG